ncbi:MAG: aminomethyl-transferring glycine dehydrogenase subunit GcvPB [Candidatus Methanofastidiosa archaeon]|nr:aminomethyl-transferring glycine dehydrogenase subunit GcvPB [Candidatus Methanofastidiosa archaeon]
MYRQASGEWDLRRYSSEGKRGYVPIDGFGHPPELPMALRRDAMPEIPELSEIDVVRHYISLSQMNFGVDNGFYPLGSCTMKYNPKICELLAMNYSASSHHPLDPQWSVKGNIEIMGRLSELLAVISGMDYVTLQPAAGAQGEFLGAKMISAYHKDRGEARDEMIVPDTAHGTNPASAAMAGYRIVEVPSGVDGQIDTEALEACISDRTAGLMLTNPNTLGIFEAKIGEISELVHGAGGLLYYDGANLNALLGRVRPGDMGFDIVHFNLHKTFSTPHGGGGPGAGAIGVKSYLKGYLPSPMVASEGESYVFRHDLSPKIQKIRAYHGNFAIILRAYAYLVSLGYGIRDVSELSVLNANYLLHRLKEHFDVPFLASTPLRKHEFVISCERIRKDTGVTALDFARRLLDFGHHAPTVYFPLIVKEALMIEPTETESRSTLDSFVDAMIKVKEECYRDPDLVKNAPYSTSRRKIDVVKAVREPKLSWMMEGKG